MDDLEFDPEDDAMLKLVQVKNGQDREKLTSEHITVAYSAAVIEYELDNDVPILPKEGVGSDSPFGPYYIYGRLGALQKFMDAVPVVVIEDPAAQLTISLVNITERAERGSVSGVPVSSAVCPLVNHTY